MAGSCRRATPSDLTDAGWSQIERHLPKARGYPKNVLHSKREILDAILYVGRTGVQWDFLPHDLPPWKTVHDYFVQWRDDGTFEKLADVLRRKSRELEPRSHADKAQRYTTYLEKLLTSGITGDSMRAPWHVRRARSMFRSSPGKRRGGTRRGTVGVHGGRLVGTPRAAPHAEKVYAKEPSRIRDLFGGYEPGGREGFVAIVVCRDPGPRPGTNLSLTTGMTTRDTKTLGAARHET